MQIQNWNLLFSGQVQGVGFRYTSSQVARNFAIVGWVRNLPNGQVQMVIQGEVSELNNYLDSLRSSIRGHISSLETELGQILPELTGFEIRR